MPKLRLIRKVLFILKLQSMRYNKQITFLLILIVVLVQLAGMTLPFTGDAGKYAAISKNIYQDHEFLKLSIHQAPYYQKPPLLMWLSAAGYFLFGEVNNFTTRLFPVLFSLLMLLAVERLGTMFYDGKTGKRAALFMGTSLIYFFYNSDLHTDLILASCTTVAIWQLAVFVEKRYWLNLITGFAFTGLAVLSKGPIGIAVPAFALGSHLLLKKDFRSIFHPAWLVGLLITTALVFPYMKTLYDTFGWEGPKFFLWTNNAGRISGEYRSNSADPFFYLYNLVVFTVPWALFFSGGLVQRLIHLFKKNSVLNKEYYTLGAALLLIIILSFASMQAPNYFYPAIPLLAINAAQFFGSIFDHTSRFKRLTEQLQRVQNSILWAIALLAVIYLFPLHNWLYLAILLLLAIAGIALSLRGSGSLQRIVAPSVISIVALFFVINAHVMPQLFSYQASIRAAEIYNREASDDAVFYTFGYAQFELFFYAKTEGHKIITEGHQDDPVNITLDEALAQDPDAWYLTDENSFRQLKQKAMHIEKVYSFDHYYLTDVNLKLLNPKTRAQSLQKIYLVKTGEGKERSN